MNFGLRLAEERKRLGLKQAEFAARVGTDVPKQSLYETGKRELRADYLAKVAEAGVDVVYVLTGKRSEGDWLPDEAGTLLSAYLALPEQLRTRVHELVRTMAEDTPAPTVHARSSSYRADADR